MTHTQFTCLNEMGTTDMQSGYPLGQTGFLLIASTEDSYLRTIDRVRSPFAALRHYHRAG